VGDARPTSIAFVANAPTVQSSRVKDSARNDPNPILLTRRPDARTFVLALVMPIATLLPVAASVGSIKSIVAPTHPMTGGEYTNAIIWTTVAAAFTWFTLTLVRSALSKTVFRAQSAEVVTLGWVRRSVRYSACITFVFARKRQYAYGAYAGTYFKITLAAKGHKPIVLRGKHKERALGPGATIFWKRFAGSDEIDRLPRHIGSIMADAWEQRLDAREHIRWCRGIIFTDLGVIPASGASDKQCVPYDRVWSQLRKDETLEVTIEGDRDPIHVGAVAPNFWPGAILLERRAKRGDPEHGDAQDGKTEHAEEDDLD